MLSPSIRTYIKEVAIQVLAGAISALLGWVVILTWKASPMRVIVLCTGIVLVTVLLVSFRKLHIVPLKVILPVAVVIILLSEAIVGWYFSTQITKTPELVGLSPAKASPMLQELKLSGKISRAKCGIQEDSITFQDPLADELVMKGSKIQIVTGIPIIEITDPVENTQVTWKYVVRGKSCGLSDSRLILYVLVHPIENNTWWVQSESIVDIDGQWKVNAQFGRTENQDVGTKFQIIALVTTVEIDIGEEMLKLPRHLAHSEVITVSRTR